MCNRRPRLLPRCSASLPIDPFAKSMRSAPSTDKGFTLVELLLVVAIVGILATVATASYRHFTKKAQSVEAEVALAEISRLQQLHRAQNGSYAGDLGAIGFNLAPGMKFYSVSMRSLGGAGGVAYQAYVYAKDNSEGSTTMVLTQYEDGRVSVEKSLVGSGATSAITGSGSSGILPETGGSSGSQSTSGAGAGYDWLTDWIFNSSPTSGSGTRTVTQTNRSVGVGTK